MVLLVVLVVVDQAIVKLQVQLVQQTLVVVGVADLGFLVVVLIRVVVQVDLEL